MRTQVIHGHETHRHRVLMEKIWSLRYQSFVVDAGWELPLAKDGRECDEFDSEATVHFALVDGNDLLAYSRIMPTTGPHLLADIYPHMAMTIPRSETVYEWSRMCITPAARSRKPSGFHSMLRAVAGYALDNGIEELSLQTHPDWILSFERAGFPTRPLGLGAVLDGALVVPFCLQLDLGGLLFLDRKVASSASVSTLSTAL